MKPMYLGLFALLILLVLYLVLKPAGVATVPENFPAPLENVPDETFTPGDVQVATFANGCFWCTEAYFLQMKGVKKVVSGYTGGQVPNPTYEQICTGTTGHAECIQVTFDPKEISYAELLEVFWRSHDPTTRNRQGNDVGTQYRSAVFYQTPTQKKLAEEYLKRIDEAKVYNAPIVTEIVPLGVFYPAEGYHQNYYAQNPRQPYCYSMIRPKLEKLKKVFEGKIKE